MGVVEFFKRNKEINKVVLLPLAQIIKNPNQPRKIFDHKDIGELAESIEENGLLQPITVRRLENDYYELIAGERRTMAFRELRRDFIPGIVEEYTDEQSAVLALIENLQRKDLNCFEEAYGIARLLDETGITQQEIAGRLGKAQSTIANKLRLLRFPIVVQKKLMLSTLTERHARALLKLEDEDKLLACIDYIVENDLNVQQTERYLERLTQPEQVKRTRLFVIKDMRIFVNTINKAVSMMNSAGIAVTTETDESEEFLEYTIKVPKSAVYKGKPSLNYKRVQ